jgi:MerR family transcriptional regulator/heat shock protein HspR
MSTERKKEDRALYVISVAAELAGVHPQTLRIYERKGLVEPQRTVGRSRRYSDRDIRRLQRIQELTNQGVSLAGVKRIIALEEELEDARTRIECLKGELEAQRTEADQAVANVHRQYRRDLIPFSKAVIRFGPGRS